ncbi:TolC family protein [Oribacterium sp. FC2011]|uniref:TolC family protein n=1 Tax=Oribacterium sp. FC2011 TaxID=1408311 RepID=UPI0004E15560|nr:TolC family protein [Oribacterium sp. FC2011]
MRISGKKLAIVMAGVMLAETFAGSAVTALAATGATVDKAPKQTSYERERSAEEWASLRDNVLTWDEIRDLVHEYNPTVSSLWINYRDNDDGGTYDLTYDDVIDNIETTYENSLGISDAQDASAELTRKTSLASVDTTIQNSDREVVTKGYQKTEVQTAEAIKQKIIGIYTSELNAKLSEITVNNDRNLLEQAQRKLQVGTGTELDVLKAEKTLKDDETALQKALTDRIKNKQTVLVNLGWKYDAEPVICAVPEVTDEMINSINLQEDITKAYGNSYVLAIDEKKLALAESESTTSSAQLTLNSDKNQVQSDMTSVYNALLTAQNELLKQQLDELNLTETLNQVTRSYQTGSASLRELESAQFNLESSKLNTELKKYALQSAYFTYISYRDGLAGTGTNSAS